MQENFRDLHVCRKKACLLSYAHVKRLHSVKWRSFILVRGYSDDARAIIENVYKFCMEEKKSVTESCIGQDCSTH